MSRNAAVQTKSRIADLCMKTLALNHRAAELRCNKRVKHGELCDRCARIEWANDEAKLLVKLASKVAATPKEKHDFVFLLARVFDLKDRLETLE